jgi:hypothetical protein
VSIILAAALTLAVPSEADLLHGISGVESRFGAITADGDLHRPLCERSRGKYQVRPIAVRELVRVGLLQPMPGFSLTNCAGIRKWLAVPANNLLAATLYLRLMLEREDGDVEGALCRYNGGRKGCIYAGQVLLIAAGDE